MGDFTLPINCVQTGTRSKRAGLENQIMGERAGHYQG